jgi:hypothetical protein
MSSLPGEQALKHGLSFEFTWAARHLIEVMEERADAIMLGGMPGEAGVDFRLYFQDREEHHQVKRAFGTKGDWTLAALESQGVLGDFRRRLDDPTIHCYMVSGIPATRLGYLANRARDSSEFTSFETHYLTGDYVGWFNDLVSRWDLSREDTWARLRRVHTRPFDEDQLEMDCLTLLRSLVVEDTVHPWSHLIYFCLEHLHTRVTSSMLWGWLEKKGIQRRIFNNDMRVVGRIAAQTARYLDGVRRRLIQPPLSRSLSSTVTQSLAESPNGKDIVILGASGGGKSAVMLQIAEACQKKGWPVLAFRLDDLPASISANQLQDALDLPDSPVACMVRASAGNPAIVIIDQLDAVSEYSGRTGQLLNRVSEFTQQLRAHRVRHPIHLVIACREVDWKYDGRLRQLHSSKSENKDENIHKVENLTDDEIQSMLRTVGLDLRLFSPRQKKELLSRPQYLALFIETRPDAEEALRIVTPKLLFDAYWDKKKRSLEQAHSSQDGSSWFKILKFITDKLAETALSLTPEGSGGDDGSAPLAVSRASLDQFSAPVIDWLISHGVLSDGNPRIRFGHESFFDYCFARLFEARGESLLNYLLKSEQTLIQRGQLRQVLAYQRDESLQTYITSVREILFNDKIRPHLKSLLATLLCDVPNPTEAEWRFIHPIITDALIDFDAGISRSVPCQVFYSFCNSLPLFKLADSHGQLAEWLKRAGDQALERLFWAIGKHQKSVQQEVWALIAPDVGNERYQVHLTGLFHHCCASQSRETFEWLLARRQRVKEGEQSHSREELGYYSMAADLALNRPDWLAEWLAIAIRVKTARKETHRFEILNGGDIEIQRIESAAASAPKEFLMHLLPALAEALKNGSISSLSNWRRDESHYHRSSVDEKLLDALFTSLLVLLERDPTYAQEVLNKLRSSDLKVMRRLYVAVLGAGGAECLSITADFLKREKGSFLVKYRGKPAACLLLERHGIQMELDDLATIESAILMAWPDYENRGSYDKKVQPNKMCLGNFRGNLQMELLRSFPSEHLSKYGRKRLAELERKFDSAIFFKPVKRVAPVNLDVLSQWGPARFYKAYTCHQRRRSKTPSWKERNNFPVSKALSEVVQKQPAEFIRFLKVCDSATPTSFIEDIAEALTNTDLDSEIALEAASHYHRLEVGGSWRSLDLLKKVKKEGLTQEYIQLVLHYLRHGEDLTEEDFSKPGEKAERFSEAAMNSMRGRAIDLLCQMLWANPDLLSELRDLLPEMMKEKCPAVRAELASLCYAVAFKDENRAFATDLFLRLATDDLPDEHVLASHWPFEFMRTGLVKDWELFKPILGKMLQSSFSEVCCAAARLVTIGVVSGIEDATQLAQRCVESNDPKVRAVCVEVLSYNLDVKHGQPWTTETFLKLADDPDPDVCRASGTGFGRDNAIDFSSMAHLIGRYVRTRAFTRGSGGLIRALGDSRSLLPTTLIKIVETFLIRLDESVEENADMLTWHIHEVSPILTRFYHENRDSSFRKKALDLIDILCLRGQLRHESLDQ